MAEENVSKQNEELEKLLKTVEKVNKQAGALSDVWSSQFDIIKNLVDMMKGMSDSFKGAASESARLNESINDAAQEKSTYDDLANGLDLMTDAASKLADSTSSVSTNLASISSISKETNINVDKLASTAHDLGEGLTEAINDELISKQRKMNDEFSASSLAAGSFGDMIDKVKDHFMKYSKTALVAAASGSGFIQGIQSSIALVSSATKVFGGFADSVFNIGLSIISIPFKMFNALIDAADKANLGMDGYRQELENIRKALGDLKGESAKLVVDAGKNFTGFAQTGLSVYQVFGNMAERTAYFREMAEALGPTMNKVGAEFNESSGHIAAYAKGLGFGNEEVRGLVELSIVTGRKFTDLGKDVLNIAEGLNGLDFKTVSREMGKAIKNVKHFGGATIKEIGVATTYAKKLGVELSKLVGTLDAFETFDQAAENAAKLGQSFGIQVDAFKAMNAQEPATIIEDLRKQMFAAGKDASTFSRQQLKLLANTTGLDEATAKLVFSQKNQGKSLEEIQDEAKNAEKRQLSQAQAMDKLANSIERLVQSGDIPGGGFFEKFFKGMTAGIQGSPEFVKLIFSIKEALRLTYMAGVQVGKWFVEFFPGVKKVFNSLSAIFEPGKFSKFLEKIKGTFLDFFKSATADGGKFSFSTFMDKIKKTFLDFFSEKEGPGKGVLEGFKTFFKTLSNVVVSGAKWLIDRLAEGLVFLVQFIKTGKLPDVKGATDSLASQIFEPLSDIFKHAWKSLKEPLKELVSSLFTKLVDYLTSPEMAKIFAPVAIGLGAMIFGTAFVRGIAGLGIAAFGSVAKEMAASFISKNIFKKVGDAAGSSMNKVVEQATSNAKVTDAIGKSTESLDKVAGKGAPAASLGRLFGKIAIIGAGLAVAGVALAVGIIAVKKILNSGGINDPKEAILPMLVIGEVAIASAVMGIGLSLIGKLDYGKMFAGAAALVGIMTVLVGATWVLGKVIKSYKDSGITLTDTVTMLVSMGAIVLSSIVTAGALIGLGSLLGGAQAGAAVAGIFGLAAILLVLPPLTLRFGESVAAFKAAHLSATDIMSFSAAMAVMTASGAAIVLSLAAIGLLAALVVPATLGYFALYGLFTTFAKAPLPLESAINSLSISTVLKSIGVLGAYGTLFAASGALILALATLGLMTPLLLLGIPAMAGLRAVFYGISSLQEPVKKMVASADVGSMIKGMGIMGAMAGIAASAALLVGSLAILGVSVVSAGPLLALLAGAGFLVLKPMFENVTTVMTGIIKQINEMPLDPQFEAKSKAYTSILKAITDMLIPIASVIPSLAMASNNTTAEVGKLTSGDAIKKTLDDINGFISKVFGEISKILNSFSGMDSQKLSTIGGAVGGIISGIGSMMKSMVPSPEILKVLDPGSGSGVMDKLAGMMRGAGKTATIAQGITDYIQDVGTASEGLIKEASKFIQAVIGKLGSSKDVKPEALNAIATILSSSAQLALAVTPPESILKIAATTGGKGPEFANAIKSVGDYAGQVSGAITKIFSEKDGLLSLVTSLTQIKVSTSEVDKATKISEIVSKLIGSVSLLMPKPELVKLFVEKTSSGGPFGGNETAKMDPDIGGKMSKIFESASGIVKAIGPIINDLLTHASKFQGKEKAGEVIATMLGAIGSIIGAVSTIVKSDSSGFSMPGTKQEDAVKKIESAASSATTIMNSLKDSIPNLVEALSKVNIGSDVTSFKAKVEAIKSISGILGEISKITTSSAAKSFDISGPLKFIEDIAKKENMDKIQSAVAALDKAKLNDKNISGIKATIEAMASLSSLNSGPLKEHINVTDLVTSVRDIGTFLYRITNVQPDWKNSYVFEIDKATRSINSLISKPSLETMSSGIEALGDAGKKISDVAGKATADSIGAALKTIVATVSAINTINSALSSDNVAKVNVGTVIKKFADSVGLGGKGEYTIKHQDFNIKIEVHAHFKAAEVEKVLILRKDSIIRDRLNSMTSQINAEPGMSNNDSKYKLPDNTNESVLLTNGNIAR